MPKTPNRLTLKLGIPMYLSTTLQPILGYTARKTLNKFIYFSIAMAM